MDSEARQAFEKRIVIAAAEALIASGCTVTVIESATVFIADSADPIAIQAALFSSGEPGFLAKRMVDGELLEGWVDFVDEVTADECLRLGEALHAVNVLSKQLRAAASGKSCLDFGYSEEQLAQIAEQVGSPTPHIRGVAYKVSVQKTGVTAT
jgi:hypothetical protein